MAQIDPSKKPNPAVAALANFCCFGVLGYFLCGQSKKAIMVLIPIIVLSFVGLGFIPALMAVLDVYKIAEALNAGEAVDENEYRFELLYKLMVMIDKTATFKG